MLGRIVLVTLIGLAWADLAAAQRPPDPGRYDMKWSEFDTRQNIDLTFGTREVEVAQPSAGVSADLDHGPPRHHGPLVRSRSSSPSRRAAPR